MNDNILDRVIFLDYDGVINIEPDNFYGYLENPEAIFFINKLCLEKNFKLVITSSWKRNPKYKQMLLDAGLDENVIIVGTTNINSKGRENDIKEYLFEHPSIKKYLILDDAEFSKEMEPYLVKTVFRIGFNKAKYEEALDKIKELYAE